MRQASDLPRIVVTGSESTGKTTLAREIAAALDTIWLPEFSRIYAEASDQPLSAATVEPIARGHMAAEDAAAPFATGALVLDADLVSTTVYSEHYYGFCAPWIMAAARERLGALYLLAETDLPWEADGVRDQPETRAIVHQRFVDRLQELGARVAPVRGVGSERLTHALKAIAEWRRSLVGVRGGPEGRGR